MADYEKGVAHGMIFAVCIGAIVYTYTYLYYVRMEREKPPTIIELSCGKNDKQLIIPNAKDVDKLDKIVF